MAGKIIHPLTSTATKSEEMDWLNRMAEMVAPGTYLSSLLTPELISHIGNAVRQDMSCDLYDGFTGAVKEAGQLRGELMKQAADMRAAAQAEANMLRQENTKLAAAQQNAVKALEAAQARIDRDHETLSATLETKYAAQRATQEANERAEALEADNAALRQHVLELKAQMFDLIMAGK